MTDRCHLGIRRRSVSNVCCRRSVRCDSERLWDVLHAPRRRGPPTSTAGGITPRSGHNTRSSTTSAPQSTSTASRHPTTNSSSGTNSTRIRELSSCSMRSTKLKPEHHLRSPQPAAVCNYLHREQRRGAVQPRRRPFREPPALYTSGWTNYHNEQLYDILSARTK